LFVVAVAMFVAGLLTVATGLLMEATDSEAGNGLTPSDLGHNGGGWGGLEFADDLEEFHSASGYVMAGLAFLHIILNWRWTIGYLRGPRRA
jgi:hypothetical protein